MLLRNVGYIQQTTQRCIPEARVKAGGFACHLLSRWFVGLFLDREDGGDMFLRNVGYFQRTTRRYIPEDGTLHKAKSALKSQQWLSNDASYETRQLRTVYKNPALDNICGQTNSHPRALLP
jgi:hypothetical protein